MSDLIEVRNSPIHGNGVFAIKRIPAGACVTEYRGEIIDSAELERREVERSRNPETPIYFFEIGDGRFIDATLATENNPARYINHACDENCEARWNPQSLRMEIIALRDIDAGEEITFDYGFDLVGFFEHPCRCGGKHCCGFIVAKILRPALLKKRARHARRKNKIPL